MPWVESSSPNFTARHELSDGDDAVAVLELLEGTRERLGRVFEQLPGGVAAVLHSAPWQLNLAQPYLPALRALTAPAGRRYLAGWCARAELHVLAPRLLERRASQVPGSREMLMLAPAALYSQLVVAANNPGLPPPYRLASFARSVRWAWLLAGAAQYFSGQTAYCRPAIGRRLHEGPRPSWPPSVRDAALLGGSIFDMLAAERGVEQAVALAASRLEDGPQRALTRAFGRSIGALEGDWQAHLARVAGGPSGRPR